MRSVCLSNGKAFVSGWKFISLRYSQPRWHPPGLMPCSAHSCFQNSIPTAENGGQYNLGTVFSNKRIRGKKGMCKAESDGLLWLPHWPSCTVIISRGILSRQRLQSLQLANH